MSPAPMSYPSEPSTRKKGSPARQHPDRQPRERALAAASIPPHTRYAAALNDQGRVLGHQKSPGSRAATVSMRMASLLVGRPTPAARASRATAVVSRASGRMIWLLDDLLAMARKRSAAFVDRDVDLIQLARDTADESTLLAAERSLRLDLRLAPGPVVYADPRSTAPCPTSSPTRCALPQRAAPSPSPPAAGRLDLDRGPRRGPEHPRRRTRPRLRPLPPRPRPAGARQRPRPGHRPPDRGEP